MTFTHESYTVAWICALPLELAAAKVFLDEVHPRLPQPKSDHNVYTLGSVSGHNVVVACLPAGVYGTTSAAAAVAYLRSTYPSIQFGLMVGIGGGVPRGNPDVRLGDIVVSKPTDTFGGVIQYDYGKTVRNGHFHRTGLINKPPPILLKAIAQMESDYMLGQVSLHNVMASNLHKEEVRKQFPRPSKDQLFQSAYDHVSNRPDCLACDEYQLVNRPERTTEEPQVHYGLIASGNQVMKDARTRDLIAQRQNILCFEMEAAGLMDEIPSLVIRGICDYCDSHKHNEWQGYAAFVAAAYAKALLTLVPLYGPGAVRKGVKEDSYWMVPFRKNLGFVGREEEISRIDGLMQQIHGPSKIAICGLGGVGKTQIALELAYRTRERDPEFSIFWIPCTSYASVEQACLNIAQLVGMKGLKPGEAKDRVKSYLSQGSSGKWLLIFDNADDMDMWFGGSAAAAGLVDFIPQNEQGRVLFTTRNRKLAVKLASSFVIEILEPDAQTGLKILEKALIRKDHLEERDATIALLGQLMFLPLAIIQAAAYINSNDLGVSDYITLLQEQEPDVIDLLSEDFGDDGRYQEIQNPVATTWLVSFQKIQESNQLAADYLSFMACVNPRDIPQSLLPPAKSKRDKLEAIGLLKGFAFVSEQVQDHALSLHRLVRLSARNWLRKHQQFHQQIRKTADQLDRVFPDDNYANRKLWREYLPHALSLLNEKEFEEELMKYVELVRNIGRCLRTEGRYKEATAIFERLISMQKVGKDDPDIPTLIILSDLASTYRYQGQWKEAEELEVEVLGIQKQVLGPEHPETLRSMANLASTYRNQGQWKKAEELEVEVLEICKRVLGPEHPDNLRSMNNLACTYREQGQQKKAEALDMQALEIRKRVLGPEHPDTLTSMANLASTYWKQGQWKEAEELQVQVLEIEKQVLGPEHPSTLTNMANLACTYRDQGQRKKAEKLEVEVLEIRKRVLDPEHPDTLVSMNNLACTYREQGQRKKAEALDMQVLEIRKRVLDPEHPDTLVSMNNLACTYREQGQRKKAEALDVQALEIRKRVLGPEHPDTLTSMANLASTYWNQGQWKEAEELQVQVLEIEKQVLGPEHPSTLTNMANLACTYRDQGQLKKAEELEVEILEVRKRVLDPEHPDTLRSMANLACTYRDQGQWNEAEELEVEILEICKRVLGPEHPDTLTTMANLALTYWNQGQWEEAEELQVQVLEIEKQVLGPEHPSTLTSMANLACTYRDQGQLEKAEELDMQVLEIRRQVLGPEHPDTLRSMANLACTYRDQGQWKEAEELEVEILEICKWVLGPEHPDTLASMNNLAHTWQAQQKVHEALALMEQCLELQNRVLGSSHPRSISSTRFLSDWKEEANSLTDRDPQGPGQAESLQLPQHIQEENGPAVVITKPSDEGEKCAALHWSRARSATPIKQFLDSHPLLVASRSGSPELRGRDLQDVD
ncbi:violaceus kinesin [Aspergillus falconensis]